MKQTIYGFILSAMVAFSSCSDKLDEKHDNPDAFTSSEIEYLFTKGALQTIAIDYVDTYVPPPGYLSPDNGPPGR